MPFRITLFTLIVAVIPTLTGCGGGGGSSSRTTVSADEFSSSEQLPELTEDLSALAGGFAEVPGVLSNSEAMTSCKTVADINPASTITGQVNYERVPLTQFGLDYSNIVTLPVRGLIVEAVAAENNSCTTNVVAATLSNGNGDYGLVVSPNQAVCIQVRAQLYRDSSLAGAGWHIQLTDNTQNNAPYYLLDNRVATPNDLPVRDLLAGSGSEGSSGNYTQSRAAAPFAILDVACEAIDTVIAVDSTVKLPLLYFHWSTNNTPSEPLDNNGLAEGDIGGAFYKQTQILRSSEIVSTINQIYLLGDEDINTDEYDSHVISHEFAHYLSANLGRYDARGGSHILNQRLDMRLAFEEGWADAFSGMVLENATPNLAEEASSYRDSSGINQTNVFRFSLDRNNQAAKGWYSESSVYSIFYNLFDDDNDGISDQLSLGFAGIYQTIGNSLFNESDAFISIYTFINSLKQLSGNDFAIDTLVAAEDFESINSDFGVGEDISNNDVSTNDDVVAVYTPLQLDTPVRLCSTDDFGTINKLINYQFLSFNALENKTYSVRVTPVAIGPSVILGKPVFEIYRRGKLQTTRTASSGGDELSFTTNLNGVYTMTLADANNIDDESSDPGRYCFEVEIN